MKTMKSFLVMLLVAMMPMFITSCEQVSNYDEQIVGEWTCTQMQVVTNDGENDYGYFEEEYWVWEFTEDGKFIQYFDWEEEDAWTYEVSGKKLYTRFAAHYMSDHFSIATLTDTELVLEVTYEYEGFEAYYTFTFKRL